MKKRFILPATGLILLLAAAPARSAGLTDGSRAPFFQVESGDEKELTLDMIKGKQILIFYEDTDSVEKNCALKNELNKFFNEQPENRRAEIVRLAVIDCSGAFWPMKGIWRDKLIENSRKEGLTIYGDWEGDMLEDYRLVEDESNVIVIDRGGVIRYFHAGQVPPAEIEVLKALLKKIWLNGPPDKPDPI